MVGIDVLAGLVFLVVAVLAIALPIGILWLVVKLVVGLVWLLGVVLVFLYRGLRRGGGRLFAFVRGELLDTLGAAGSALAAAFFVPLVVGNVALGRWSKVGHYGRALEDELVAFGLSVYRIALGHPIRLLGLTALTDGIERRLPQAMASSPGKDLAGRKGAPAFPGYRVVGTLPRGGSGAHLYLAEPEPEKHDRFAADGAACPGRVVIKAFSLEQGSTLPQIVRESRALGSAKDLGLVLDYELEGERFYYVMPYVPGDDLGQVTRRLHDRSGPEGLGPAELERAVGYVADVVASLDRFHAAGLWHKDIKPSNVIVSGDEHAYLVDLGLVTPLRSALTLTTHGTEYFRDPEMVRLAMQGVKVHEVDGVKFDLYSAGAVLYSLLENSFPAHGSLSRTTKRAPDALLWIVRRAMADLSQRYGSAREMLADLQAVREAPDPWALQVAGLPSVRGDREAVERVAAAGGARTAAFRAFPAAAALRGEVAGSGAESADGGRSPWPGRWPWARSARVASAAARGASAAARSAGSAAARAAQDVRRKTRVGAGALVAVVLFAMMAVVPVTLLLRDGRAPWAQAGSYSPAAVHVAARESVWEQRLRALFAESDDAFGRLLVDCDRGKCRNPSHPCDLHPRAVTADFDVLVLNDLPAGSNDELVPALQRVLEDQDYTVWGLGPIASAASDEIERIAAARKAVGLASPGDTEASDRLRDLVEADEDLDAVLWLGAGRRSGSAVYRLVTGEPEAAHRAVSITFGERAALAIRAER